MNQRTRASRSRPLPHWAAVVSFALLCTSFMAPPLAFGQGLPVGFEYELADGEIHMRISADDVVDGVRVQLRTCGSQLFTGQCPDLQRGQTCNLSAPAPTSTTTCSLTIEGDYAGSAGSLSYDFEIAVAQDMEFDVDTSTFDATAHRFVMTMNQSAGHVELVVRGEDGAIVADRVVPFNGEPAGTPLTITWSQPPVGILTVDVKAVGESGAWSSRQYVPWQVQMDAVYVSFPSGSADIPSSDEAMLADRLRQIQQTAARVSEWVDVELYVAGYTDTVGSSGDNQQLSEARARSLAQFMRQGGWTAPIHFQGFGEDVLAVPTGDSVEEAANRRALFILGTSQRPITDQIPRSNWRTL